ncbi:MAG TPA: phosphotransferase [Solirubrobacteraceae bacterium]|jgi:thiamine kinase-like enzyme
MVDELDDLLTRLQASLAPMRGEPRELDGGITNRNFLVTFGDVEYVVRRPGKDTELLGIDRDAERIANEAAAGLGIAPAVALALDDCLVTRFVACRSIGVGELAASLDEVDELARALRSFHDCGAQLPSRFHVPALLDDYAATVRARGGAVAGEYDEAVRVAVRICDALAPAQARPCHNDLLAGNVIRSREDGRLLIVDWEYAGMGDPRFDLGNLSVNNQFSEATDERLLHAYYGGAPSDAQRAALKLMRALSDAREAAWGTVQASISELDFDFAGYARKHFERLRAAVERPQFEQWLVSAGA